MDILGKTFGRWTVISNDGVINRYRRVTVRCLCGTIRCVVLAELRRGKSQSCGCVHQERLTTHGEAGKTPEYRAWQSMLRRCRNPTCDKYVYYGGRGIAVCKRWHRYENFLADMGRRPSPKHSLDRKNNDRSYTPTNCRWATQSQQRLNSRNTKMVTFHGITQPLIVWARQLGINYGTLRGRFIRGWALEDILDTTLYTPSGHKRRVTHG